MPKTFNDIKLTWEIEHKNHINVHRLNWDFYVNIHKNHINVHRFNWDFLCKCT
jgi:hypothetical protein